MTRQQIKTCGLPIGNITSWNKYERLMYDPVTAIVALSVASAGATAYQAYDASKDAKKEAKKQDALIKKQEDMIAKEKDKQDREAAARRERSQGQELLTGTETGLTGEPKTTLLSGAK